MRKVIISMFLILFAVFIVNSVLAYAESKDEEVSVNISQQITALEDQLKEVEVQQKITEAQLVKASEVYKSSKIVARDFKKNTEEVLKDEKSEIKDQIDKINKLLKGKVPTLPDACDPSDPDCKIDCRAYRGVCIKGHCCF